MGDWFESTEGDLDHDLTEEAGYGPWEPPRRAWWPIVSYLLSILALISIIGTIAIVAIR